MKQYLEVMKEIIDSGEEHEARTIENRISIYGVMSKFKMKDGFPLVTTRNVPYLSMIKETLWFLTGDYKITALQEQGVHIWDKWAITEDTLIPAYVGANLKTGRLDSEDNPEFVKHLEQSKNVLSSHIGNIGPMYGVLWRNHPNIKMLSEQMHPEMMPDKSKNLASDKLIMLTAEWDAMPDDIKVKWGGIERYLRHRAFDSIDQIQELLVGLRERPFSSRHVVSAWATSIVADENFTPEENVLLGNGALAACHCMFQCFVKKGKDGNKNKLSLAMYQRSADFPVGSVFNIAQYALLLHLFAHVTDMEADELIYMVGDCHIYDNQMEQAKLQVLRTPKALPTIRINPDVKDLFAITADDIEIIGYEPDESIKYQVAK